MARASNPGQTERVYHLIRDSIIGSRFLPGVSLREADLAAKYQVSRNTIKKVLLMLDNDGLVTVEMNEEAICNFLKWQNCRPAKRPWRQLFAFSLYDCKIYFNTATS